MIPSSMSENIIKNVNYFDDLHIIAAFHKTFPNDAIPGKQIQKCQEGRYSLEMILSGKTALKLDQTVIPLESPCVFWIGDHHRTFEFLPIPGCAYEHLWIDFSGERGRRIYNSLRKTFSGEYTNLHSGKGEVAEIFRHFATLFKVARRPEPSAGNTLLIEQLVYEILLHGTDSVPEQADPHGIALLARQIKSEPFKKYDTECMAEKVGVSSVHFRMLFRQKTGKSLHQYILEQQMLTAGELLKKSQFRIGELADYCNYPDIGTFSRAFKRYYKVSPRQWLEMYYGEKNGSGAIYSDRNVIQKGNVVMEKQEVDYQVFVNHTQIPVYRAAATFAKVRAQEDGSTYGIGVFDSDEPVQVTIFCKRDLSTTKILPENAIPSARISPEKIEFQLAKHGSYIFETDGPEKTPLVLFFNPVEKNAPSPDAPTVRYFGPGVHSPGKIELRSGETLYLASGAIVEGNVWAQGDHIKICGHGILTQRTYPRQTVRHCLDFYHCTNVELRDFITCDPCYWNVVFRDCHNVLMDNVKICGSRMHNDDGIDICNSTDMTIRNCFIRSQDDVIAIKGLMDQEDLLHQDRSLNTTTFAPDSRGIRNILVENCILWCDAANVIRIGYECIAQAMEEITVRNCDVIHTSRLHEPVSAYWSHTVWYIQASHRMPVRNLLFEDIRIHLEIPSMPLMKIVSMECLPWSEFGRVENCTFRNIAVTTADPAFQGEIMVGGIENAPRHSVENITLDNVTVNGKKIHRDSENISFEGETENIRFF